MKALVISGGGVKGAFAVGILKGLMNNYLGANPGSGREDFFKEYEIISGTSTGALIAPLAATGQIEELEKLYTNADKLKGYYKWYLKGNIANIFTKKLSFFSVNGLKNELHSVLVPIYDKLQDPSCATLFFAAVSMITGELVYFSNKALVSADPKFYRIQKVNTVEEMIEAIMASANQPVFAPLVPIKNEVTNETEYYADGGVREYIPIKGVVDQGATDIDVIINSPLFLKRKNPNSSLYNILQRTIELLADEVGESDIQYAKSIINPNVKLNIFRPSLDGYGPNHDIEFPFKESNLDFDSVKMTMLLNKGMEVVAAPTAETHEVYSIV